MIVEGEHRRVAERSQATEGGEGVWQIPCAQAGGSHGAPFLEQGRDPEEKVFVVVVGSEEGRLVEEERGPWSCAKEALAPGQLGRDGEAVVHGNVLLQMQDLQWDVECPAMRLRDSCSCQISEEQRCSDDGDAQWIELAQNPMPPECVPPACVRVAPDDHNGLDMSTQPGLFDKGEEFVQVFQVKASMPEKQRPHELMKPGGGVGEVLQVSRLGLGDPKAGGLMESGCRRRIRRQVQDDLAEELIRQRLESGAWKRHARAPCGRWSSAVVLVSATKEDAAS